MLADRIQGANLNEKRWLVNADIENRHIIRNNESWRYPIIHNSVWSNVPTYLNPEFQDKLLQMTKIWLEQN